MKLKTLTFILIFLSSIISYQKGSVVCISKDGIELEKPLQSCEHHESETNIDCDDNCDEEHFHASEECQDYEIADIDFYKSNYKIKCISTIVKINNKKNNYFIDFNYKPSFKDEFIKKVSYNRLKILYNPILKHIKTVVIRT